MKTITFYSYKGGVGRTLLLANIAKYLVRFGQKVFAMDFDLEAPGLHYKLNLGHTLEQRALKLGVVDYVYSYAVEGKKPQSIREYAIHINTPESTGGTIYLMPAGNVPSANYWQRLAQISWHDMFYSDNARGIPFFLELKARIEAEFSPDYLLIDSRTGITEIGGVATTVLPDSVVCLLLRNRENLDGARAVLRSIKRTLRLRNQDPVNIVPVVTRLPVVEGSKDEKRILDEIRVFLNQETQEIADNLSISDLAVLHTDRSLEIEETLLVDSKIDVEKSVLLRDYIQLFAKLIPREIIEPQIGPLVREALSSAWDDPVGTERDLVALTEYSTHPEPFEFLIKFYRLRNADRSMILKTAYRYWQLTHKADEPFLVRTVKESFKWDQLVKDYDQEGQQGNQQKKIKEFPIQFIDEVWSQMQPKDIELGINLAKAHKELRNYQEIPRIIKGILEIKNCSEEIIVECIDLLKQSRNYTEALRLIDRFKARLSNSKQFQFLWAEILSYSENKERIVKAFQDEHFQPTLIRTNDQSRFVELLVLADKQEEARRILKDLLSSIEVRGGVFGGHTDSRKLIRIGKLSLKMGMIEDYKSRLREDLDKNTVNRIMSEVHGREPRW